MKIRTMLIIAMIIFSLLAMTVFTVFLGIHLSASSENQYKETMREMSGKQSGALLSFFDSYTQRFNIIAGNPAVKDFAAFMDAGGEIKIEAEADDENDGENGYDFAPEYLNALRALQSFAEGDSGITGITIFAEPNPDSSDADERAGVIMSVGGDFRDFIMSTRRERLSENQFAVNPVSGGYETEQDFELIQFARLGDSSYYMLCTYSSADITEFFNHSRPSTRGKLILICPLNNLLDNNLRGNLDEEYRTTQEYQHIKRFIQDDRFRNGLEFFSFEVGREESHALFNEVGNTGWMLGVIGRTADIEDNYRDATSLIRNLAIFLGILMTGFSVFFVIKFTQPLVIIRDVLTKIRRGDHDVRINIKQGNEYGEIAKEFNDLLDNVVIGEVRHRTVIEMSDNIIFEWNLQKDEVIFSNNFSKKFSYRAPTDLYKDSFLVKCKVHPEDTANYKKTLEKLAAGETIQQDEFRWKNIFGDYVWFLLRAAPIHSANNEIIKVVGVIVDIDNAKKKEKILSARANYDALTSLYNRETLEELINNEIDLIAARKNEFAILFIDVDDFKFFNDNYSHATGDQVLRFTALSINDIVSNYGMAGRFGGDEFVVCIRNAEVNDPAKTAEEILKRLGEGFKCDVGDQLSVKVSIGIAIIRDTAKRVDEIIGMADEAMYKIKKSGKSNYGFIN
ncbi:MAG: diguanylate cyclase [Oscillospiraceae bacterium]|nr:diguanylate cyclase [Oscillospiraceae bacterium]